MAAMIAQFGEHRQPHIGARRSRRIVGPSPIMGNALRALRDAKGWTQDQAAAAWGMSKGGYVKLEYGDRRLNRDHLAKATKLYGVSASKILGEVPFDPDELIDATPSKSAEGDVSEFERIETDGVYSRERQYHSKIPGGMPELDFEAGAGEGRIGDTYQIALGKETYSGHRVVAEWKFSEDWLRSEVKSSSRHTIVAPVIGDSMRGSYEHGDRVLVDLEQRTFIDGVVFVISVDGNAPSIKRLAEVYQTAQQQLTIISDNPAIPDRVVPASIVTIIGRVVGVVSRR